MAIDWIKIEKDGESPNIGDYVLFFHAGFVNCGEYDEKYGTPKRPTLATSDAMVDFHDCSYFAYINNPIT